MAGAISGGYGPWLDHAAMDARRKNQALAERVARLEAQVAELVAALKARYDADATALDLAGRWR